MSLSRLTWPLVVLALTAFVWVATPEGQRGGGFNTFRDNTGEPSVGTAVISGSVVVAGSGTPVRRARVTLTGTEIRGGRSSVTDEMGQFSFAALPAGRFTMTASKPGFVNTSYGAKRAGRPGTPIQVAEGQQLERMEINLPRGGVITGRVIDEHGDPAAGMPVRAFRDVMQTGERVLQSAGQDETDDRGVYRIYELQPGEYVVNAVPRNMNAGDVRQALSAELSNLMAEAESVGGGRGGNLSALAGLAVGRGATLLGRVTELQSQIAAVEQEQSVGYAPIYYPGTSSAAAAVAVPVEAGEERIGVDFRLQLVPTARVSGAVVGGNILPQGTQVALVPSDWGNGVRGPGMNMTRVDAAGEFSFRDVTPGDYVVQARATVRESSDGTLTTGGRGRGRGGDVVEVLWASTPLAVMGQDVSDVLLNLSPGMKISGRVVFDGSGTPPEDLTDIRVSVSARGTQAFDIGGIPPAEVGPNGRFTVTGVSPGRYGLSASMGGGRGNQGFRTLNALASGDTAWRLASATVNGVDTLDFPIDIGPFQEVSDAVLTFSDRTQQLTGTIQDTSGRPTSDYTIIVFPSDSRYWLPQARRIGSTRPDTDGRFTFRDIPPGEYRLTAVTDAEPGEWYDPSFLDQLRQVSIPFSLSEGETRTQNIQVAGG